MMPNKSQPNRTTQMTQTTQTTHLSTGSATATMPPRTVYSREFKLEALRLLKSSGKTKTELERELVLYQGQLHLWERAFNKEGGSLERAFPGTGYQSDAEAELRQLRSENEILRQERDILKRSSSHLLQDAGPRLKFAFIHKYQREYEVKIMCRVLGVSRGGYYTWVKRQEEPPSRREMANQQLTAAIQATFTSARSGKLFGNR
jgi:transposase-like protein